MYAELEDRIAPDLGLDAQGALVRDFGPRQFKLGFDESLKPVVRDFTGHGVGAAFHTGLIIPHYDSAPLYNDVIKPGMVFTIEPMLTLGTYEWEMWADGWTVTTRDKSLTAQFEHTIVVRESGVEILTLSD